MGFFACALAVGLGLRGPAGRVLYCSDG